MASSMFMRVDEVAEELCISKSHAYKVVHRLNKELKGMGYVTIAGRISKKYFMEKVCYGEHKSKEGKV